MGDTDIVDGGEGGASYGSLGDSIDTDLLPRSGQAVADDSENADAAEIRGVEQEETHDKEKELTEEEKARKGQRRKERRERKKEKERLKAEKEATSLLKAAASPD